ncbi:MAG: nucleotidyltransferase family protein, partial [Desulfobacterota bacterium]|nr:nucleotidyltransferase family protein [Thermodesulfobacteriota bacterium]
GVGPLLYNSLLKNLPIDLPEKLKIALKEEYISNSALSLFYGKALKEIVAHLQKNEITFALHKGLGIAALLYPDPVLRPCGGDFDLFIKREDYSRTKSRLREIGYQLLQPEYEKYEINYAQEVKFIKLMPGKDILIELHLEFNAHPWTKISGFDLKGFWDKLVAVKYNDFYIPCLPVEPNLFFLILHCAVNHNFDRLILFCDIDLLIRKYQSVIDWEHIADYACQNNCRKAFYFTLNYCRQMLATPIPDSFLKRLTPGRILHLLLSSRRIIFSKDKDNPKKGLKNYFCKKYMHLLLLDNPLLFYKSMALFLRWNYYAYRVKKKTGRPFF